MPAAVPAALVLSTAILPQVTLGTAVLMASLTLAATVVSNMLAPGMPSMDRPDNGMKINTRDTQEPLKIVYGTQMIGGNDIYIEATGSKNKDLWIVMTLAEGECDSIYQVDSIDQVYFDDKLYNEYGGNISYWFYNGSSTQTYDTNLNAAQPNWIDNLRYTCYIVYKLHYDTDYFNNLPNRKVILKGRKLYDFRDDTTAWSDNPVLALYDYITNTRYGLGKSSDIIDITSWTSAANYCDTENWTINLAINKLDDSQKIIDDICSLFRGQLVWYDGKFYLRYADLNYESSCLTITDDMIALGTNNSASIKVSQPSMFNKYDLLKVKYIDPDKFYVLDEIPIGDELGTAKEIVFLGCNNREMATRIGSYTIERQQLDRTISLVGKDECLQLEPYDVVTLNSSAIGISNQLMRVEDATIVPNGLVNLTLSYESLDLYDNNYNNVTEGTYTCNLPDKDAAIPNVGNVSVTEEQYDFRLRTYSRLKITFDEPADYPWYKEVEVWVSIDGGVTYEHAFNTTNDFNLDPVEEGVIYIIRLKTVNLFGAKTSDINDYKFQHEVLGLTDEPESLSSLTAIANTNSVNLLADKVSDSDIELYEFRLGSSWGGGIFLAALRSPNYSLTGVKPGTHTFFCNTLSNNGLYGETARSAGVILTEPPDGWSITHTETENFGTAITNETFTTGTSLDVAISLAHDDLSLSPSPVVTTTDGLTTYDEGNDYTIDYPNGTITVKSTGSMSTSTSYYIDYTYTTGTYDNTEYFDYSSDDYLKCSHTGGVYTGTWTSQTYDLGSSDTYLVYLLADTLVIGDGTDWDDQFPSPTTWDAGDVANRSWTDIFELATASKIEITLKYGDSTSLSSSVSKLEILSAIVTGRYFQIVITITDPSSEINGIIENYSLKFCQ